MLRFERLRPAHDGAADAALGALGYGPARPSARHAASTDTPGLWPVPARPLLDTAGFVDRWCIGEAGTGSVHHGITGRIRWRSAGGWLFGAADLRPDDENDGLSALSHRLYTDLFATLRAHGNPSLLRLWNYLPGITAPGGSTDEGMERYRAFNIGRQQAFIDAGEAAFDGAPAACALGLRDEEAGLRLRFLAGPASVRAIENPRQVSAYRYPAEYGPRAPTFSRAALAPLGDGTLGLFVSGTASIVGHASVHGGDTPAQVDETLRNLHAVFDAARSQCDAPLALEDSAPVVYVRHAHEAQSIRDRLAQALGASSRFVREAVFLEADICRPELDVEIETLACAPGRLRTIAS